MSLLLMYSYLFQNTDANAAYVKASGDQADEAKALFILNTCLLVHLP